MVDRHKLDKSAQQGRKSMEEQTFGALLRRLRDERELTQEELGKQAYVSASYISKLEREDRPPSGKIAEILADCLRLQGADRVEFVSTARSAREWHKTDQARLRETRPSPN
jgi:transcriptional regulator with XRE-family HTH domain